MLRKHHHARDIAREKNCFDLSTNSNGRYRSGEKVRMMAVKAFIVSLLYLMHSIKFKEKIHEI